MAVVAPCAGGGFAVVNGSGPAVAVGNASGLFVLDNVTIGVVIGAPAMWQPLNARVLMLQGAELLVSAADSVVDPSLEQDMLRSRGFENVAAVLRANPPAGPGTGANGYSLVSNWCNDMLPDG